MIIAYVHELEELANVIGSVSEREMVNRFFSGINVGMKRMLWLDGYNPEASSWDEVTARAEVIEIAENVMESKNKRKRNGISAGIILVISLQAKKGAGRCFVVTD